MFNKYKFYCNYLHINFKKSIISTLIVCVLFLGIGVYFLINNNLMSLIFIMFSIVYYFISYSSLKTKYKQTLDSKEIAFNAFYRYVITYLEANNILYVALKNVIEHVDEVLVDDINNLIMEIEDDNSLQPFINFSNVFEDETIKQMVLLLYRTQESKQSEVILERINKCLIDLQDNSINSYLNKETKKIEKFYMVPLILSALLMITVTIFVFSLISKGQYV